MYFLNPICALLLVIITHPSTESNLGDVAAVIPNPHQNLAVSKPIKYVTRNGIEVTLDDLKKKMDDENEKEQADVNLFSQLNKGRRKKFKRNRLSCHMCDAPDCSDPRECYNAISCFTSIFRDVNGVVHKSKGCSSRLDHHIMYCSTKKHDGRKVHEQVGKSSQYSMECCKTHSFCNNATEWPELPPVPSIGSDYEDYDDTTGTVQSPSLNNEAPVKNIAMAIALPIGIIAILIALIILIMKHCHNTKMKNLKATLNPLREAFGVVPWDTNRNTDGEFLDGIRFRPVGDSTLRAFGAEDSLTSGSGSGMPQLVQRTLAKEICLREMIGKGRYGKVHRGTWNDDNYAVKIFLTKDEDSFKREIDIYSTVLLRHENILGYVGSDVASFNSCTQLWLVTDYYPKGSLYDYMRSPNRNNLTVCQAYGMLSSCLSGLVHLHQEIFGTNGTKTQDQQKNYKPAIAHRDIKSKNILVREDGFSCVIADFGLAVTYSSAKGEPDVRQNYRVGTKRYMSPEILDCSIENNKTFESYKRADVYAFALVMWEILQQTECNSSVANDLTSSSTEEQSCEYSDPCLPYHLHVGPDPSFEEMKKVVCVDKIRPHLPNQWTSEDNPFFSRLCSIMKECWHERPDVRHSMLRIKKNLNELQQYARQMDQQCNHDSTCYLSQYGNSNRNPGYFSPNRNEISTLGYNRENPRSIHNNLYNDNHIDIGRNLGLSRHSITGGGYNRAMGSGYGAAGSGSVNSTVTQSSYCSSGYQSKLGSQSGSVDQSGLNSSEILSPFGSNYQQTNPTSANLSQPLINRLESQSRMPTNVIVNQGQRDRNFHFPRMGANSSNPQLRNTVPLSPLNGNTIQNSLLDEQEEEENQS